MQCYTQKVYLQFEFLFIFLSFEVLGSISVLDKGVVPLERDSVGIQFFVDVENKDRISNCKISTSAKDCCLTDNEEDCSTMQVYGGIYNLKPMDRDTFIFVYPTLYPHDQVGHCNFVLEYQCGRRRRSKRQIINIPFDTKLVRYRKKSNLLSHYVGSQKKTECDTLDQNSLNNCEPVDCDFKYGGERPFYDLELAKCSEASLCESDPDEELPELAYVPSINACRDLEHPLTISDIYAISTGVGVVTKPPHTNDIKVELKSNCSTISQNLNFLRDLLRGNFCPMPRTDTSDFSKSCKTAILSIVSYIVGICGLVLSFICCIQTMIWLHRKIKNQDLSQFCKGISSKLKKPECPSKGYDIVNSDVRNSLLRDVIVKDIPMELRDSIVDICDRMERRVKKKKRYRRTDVGSQISLSKVEYDVMSTTATSSTDSLDDCGKQEN